MSARGRHFLALDIEAAGQDTVDYPILAIGGAVVTLDADGQPEIVDTTFWRVGPAPTQDVFEPRCWADFWGKPAQAEALAWLQADPDGTEGTRDPCRVAVELRAWLDTWLVKGAHIVTDNAAFDCGRINEFLCANKPHHDASRIWTLNYGPPTAVDVDVLDQAYIKSPVDIDELQRARKLGLLVGGGWAVEPECPVAADHTPHHDAASIAWQAALIERGTGFFSKTKKQANAL
jgi:hypothetical protein